MGEGLPADWERKFLGEVFNIAIGGTPSRSVQEYWDVTKTSGNPWASIRDLSQKTVIDTAEYISDAGVQNSNVKKVPKGTVMMSFKLTVGRTAMAGRDLYTNEAIASFVPKCASLIDTQYFFQGLQYWNLLENVDQAVKGATLNKEKLALIEGIFPEYPEQQKIAAILTSVDDVIEKTEAQISKLQDLKKGMMQELLTKGIGHTEFKDSPVGRIPKGWCVRLIKSLCTHVVDCVNKTAPTVDYQTPFKMIRTTNVRDGKVDIDNVRYASEETYKVWTRRLTPEKGDLIFTREAPVGECGILQNAKGVFLGQRTMLYRTNPETTSAEYLMYSLKADYCLKQFDDFSGGSTTPHMRVPDCEKILIKIPPMEEQRQISSALLSIDAKADALRFKCTKLYDQKKALMQDLLTGKVRVMVA